MPKFPTLMQLVILKFLISNGMSFVQFTKVALICGNEKNAVAQN